MSKYKSPLNGQAKGTVSDAVPDNWVDRFAPTKTRPYLRLSRADRPIGTWLLFLPCVWGIGLGAIQAGNLSLYSGWIAFVCAAGAWLMRGAGCTWNDITDREFDAQVARTKSRPLPSGQVTLRQALIWMVAQSLMAFFLLLTLPLNTIIWAVCSLGLVAIYPFAKRFTWWPQIFLGLAFNWGVWVGWSAQAGNVTWGTAALYISGIFWTLFYDTIYAYQDIEDDKLIGVKSTARFFGDRPHRWLWAFALLAGLSFSASALSAGGYFATGFLASLASLWLLTHMAWQMRGLNLNDAQGLLARFRANSKAGIAVSVHLVIVAFWVT